MVFADQPLVFFGYNVEVAQPAAFIENGDQLGQAHFIKPVFGLITLAVLQQHIDGFMGRGNDFGERVVP